MPALMQTSLSWRMLAVLAEIAPLSLLLRRCVAHGRQHASAACQPGMLCSGPQVLVPAHAEHFSAMAWVLPLLAALFAETVGVTVAAVMEARQRARFLRSLRQP